MMMTMTMMIMTMMIMKKKVIVDSSTAIDVEVDVFNNVFEYVSAADFDG